MKNKIMKRIAMALTVTLMVPTGMVINTKDVKAKTVGNVVREAEALPQVTTIGSEETTTSGNAEETTTENPTTENPTTENPTTEAPTTVPDGYEIINGAYKVKDNVLVEYLGNREDKNITSLEIPASIQKIDQQVFKGCKYIEKITFETSSNLTEISDYAFNGCSALKTIVLPNGLKKFGYRVFKLCTSLTEITMPNTVTEGNQIFGIDGAIKKVTFENGIKTIPAEFLRNAYTLESVSFGTTVISIGTRAFYNCKSLKSVSLPATVTKIGTSTFYNCAAMTKVTMSKNVTKIGKYAFKKCSKLKSLTLYKKVASIGADAFAEDRSLTLKVYANSYGKSYARRNKLKWEFTKSELERQAKNKKQYNDYLNKINAKDKTKYKLKYLKNYVPQGSCIIGKYLVVSMYAKGLKKKSILLVYKLSSGKYVKKVVLPSKDHVGSVTNIKNRLAVGLNNISTNDHLGIISYSKLKKTKPGKKVKYDYMVHLPGRADFATFDGTYFWSGHSANISAPRMYGYKVSVKKKKLVFTKKHSFAVPSNSQGLVVKKLSKWRREFIFSQSYGLISNSTMITYRTNIRKASSLGTTKKNIVIPAMSEGIILNKNYMYIVFESAAGLYCDNPDKATEIRINNVWKIKSGSL